MTECARLGIDALTLYSFSAENWKRPKEEVDFLMELCRHYLVAERDEIMALVALSSKVLNDTLKPGGMNLGMNLDHAGGAGIVGHLHVHIVPLWVGDTNFMPAVFETRVLSVSLSTVCRKLKAGFKSASRPRRKR